MNMRRTFAFTELKESKSSPIVLLQAKKYKAGYKKRKNNDVLGDPSSSFN